MIYIGIIAVLGIIVWYLEFKAYSIPVLYYHHVEPTDPISPQVFESQMKYLISKGYTSISLNELYDFMIGNSNVPRRSFVLTFDDGFYCNYRYLLPILQKYKLKATIFVVSGVRKQTINLEKREQSRGYPSRTGANIESSERFATWDELKLMLASGLVQVEDHSLFHDRIYINDKVVGFNTGLEFDWPIWGDKRPGTVKYQTGSYIAHKNFTGDPKLNEYLVKVLKQQGLDPSIPDTTNILKKEYRAYRANNPVKFIYESEANFVLRSKMDIEKSRKLIEEHAGIKPMFFCFPWGEYNNAVIDILKELGYKGAITTDKGPNIKGGNPYKIRRFKVYRTNLNWFKRYYFLHRSRILVTLYSLIYGWL
ncbi:MAG: polysaccharide deacetylase family protein [bacterium]